MIEEITLIELIHRINEFGQLRSQDFQAYAIGLLEEMVHHHSEGRILKINASKKVVFDGQALRLNGSASEPSHWTRPLFRKSNSETPLKVSEEFKEVMDADGFTDSYENLSILKEFRSDLTKPVYFTEYRCWEESFEHFDAVTDIFNVGMVLASVAFGLDFNDPQQLEKFVSNRTRLYYLNRHLHPALVQVIFEMTELFREDRLQDAHEVLVRVKSYREINPENHVDLTKTEGFKNQDLSSRGNWILSRLKNRLYDMSKRNNLLYYKEKDKFINLTVGSIPHILDHKNIKEEDLLLWNTPVAATIRKSRAVSLNSFLQFDTNKYLAPRVNKVRLEARKSNNEFGYSPLRTVIAFIHWYNFKENPEEKITSPLLLLKTELIKKKGLKDNFKLEFEDLVAEVNPVIVQYFKDSFGLILPDYVDLETSSVSDLIDTIKSQIAAGNSGVNISWKRVPQIRLMHSIAKRKLNTQRRRNAKRGSKLNIRAIDYSYDSNDFVPLGLQLFKKRVRHKNQHLEHIINEDLKLNVNQIVNEKEASFYHVDQDSKTDPFHWEIDTTNMTLGNFNYRKMSLVKDYNHIIETEIKDEVFEQLFSEIPVRNEQNEHRRNLSDDFPIVPLDPTQNFAINQARTGKSYVIQGPPGTGKSQTITNLIADYLAAGKKVLFVCEKRAALDVVFHRLKNKGLDVLSSLVHDSRSDKKEFILDLKRTYEQLLIEKNNFDQKHSSRIALIERIHEHVHTIQQFHSGMSEGDTPLNTLIETVIKHGASYHALEEAEYFRLPEFREWETQKSSVESWIQLINEKNISKTIADCQLAHVQPSFFEDINGKLTLEIALKNLEEKIDQLLEEADLELDHEISNLSIEQLRERQHLAKTLAPIQAKGAVSILEINSPLAQEFNSRLSELKLIENELETQKGKNLNWSEELMPDDCKRLVNSWRTNNSGVFKFLSPSYYASKKQINSLYNFSAHQIKPSIDEVINELEIEVQLLEKLDLQEKQILEKFGLVNLTEQLDWVKTNQRKKSELLSSWLANTNDSPLEFFIASDTLIEELFTCHSQVFLNSKHHSLDQINTDISSVREHIQYFSLLKPHIKNLQHTSEAFKTMLLDNKWSFSEFEFHCAYKEMLHHFDDRPHLKHIDSVTLQNSANAIQALLGSYYNSNVEVIHAAVTRNFLEQIRITESPAAKLTAQEKEQKKVLRSARKILENEFGKSMRYKSVRELFNNEARDILTTIKPVWLMSPLSLSDIMPINTDIFDVVIFDEASQITLEEGVPALFRTKQIIVVGDEMQMPPTNFFGSNSSSDEDLEQEEEVLGFSLDADSILNQSCRKLPSVMLGWHYRSRRESLISFSNAAFYNRSLLTIPDASHNLDDESTEGIAVSDVAEPINVDSFLKKSISYHYIEQGVYQNRKNADEASYIAQLVRAILNSESEKSIGIVAFSMDQQNEIEMALELLGTEDPKFESKLEEEYQRIEEDQFCGLFVKNLENVQGDERDIIILSICYAQNATGKMYMNFGPINRRGGEKRLNVIFSRSKQNMMVVSSILPHEITNDYNEGANYFKKFLSFAKHTSDGHLQEANNVLETLHRTDEAVIADSAHVLTDELAKAIESKGYSVKKAVGQSSFKCDMVISKPDENTKSLAILIDHRHHYLNSDIIEQYVQKPEILRNFGWKACRVFAKDWLLNKKQVLTDIDTAFRQEHVSIKPEEIKDTADTEELPIEEKPAERERNITKPIQEKEKTIEKPAEKTPSSADWIRLEFKEGTSNKFWQARTDQHHLIVEYGRIGNKPQQKIKEYGSSEIAQKEMVSMVSKKKKKGYQPVS